MPARKRKRHASAFTGDAKESSSSQYFLRLLPSGASALAERSAAAAASTAASASTLAAARAFWASAALALSASTLAALSLA